MMVVLTGGGGLRLPSCVEPGGAGSVSARLASGRRQRGNGAPIHPPSRPALAAGSAVGSEARMNIRSSLELALEQTIAPAQHGGGSAGSFATWVPGAAVTLVGGSHDTSRRSSSTGDGSHSNGNSNHSKHGSSAGDCSFVQGQPGPRGADPTDPMCHGPQPGLLSVVAGHRALHASDVVMGSSSTVGSHGRVHAACTSATDSSVRERRTAGPGMESRLTGDTSMGTALPAPGSGHGSLPAALLALADASLPVVLPPLTSPASGTAPGSGAVSIGAAAPRLDNRDLDKLVATLGRSKATWRRALVLYEWLQEAGHTLDDRLCTTLIRVCAEHGQAVAALGVYDWMRSPRSAGGGGLSPSVYTYTAAMRAALGAVLLDRALQVWDDACAARCSPDCRLAITLIEVCTRRGDTERALAMYATMRTALPGSRLAPTVHAYTAAMRAATEGGRWLAALDVWRDLRAARCAPSAHAYSAVIAACAAGGDWQRAVALFEDMCADGIRPDVVSCTALIGALAAAGQWQRAEAVVSWMLGSGLKPNVRTYTALITALGKAAQWDRALEILGLMQTLSWGGVAPNAYTYSALLKAMAEAGEWQLAERVFSSVEADVLATQQAVCAQHAVPSLRLQGQLTGARVSGTALPCRVLEDTHLDFVGAGQADGPTTGMAGSWTSPSALYGLSLQLLPADSSATHLVTPAPASPSSLGDSQSVGSSARSSGTGHGLEMVRGLPGTHASGSLHEPTNPMLVRVGDWPSPGLAGQPLEADAACGVTCGPSCGGAAHVGTAAALVNLSLAAGPAAATAPTAAAPAAAAVGPHPLSPPCRGPAPIINEVVCSAMLLAYERAGRWSDAAGLLSRARTLGVEPNTAMYNIAMSATARAGQLACTETLFAEMGPPMSPHDAVSYEIVIAAYGAAADAQRAEAAFGALCAAGHRPHDYAYCGLVAAHSLAGDLASALRIRQRMASDNVAVTVHVYNALIAACERCGQFERALDCLRAMKRDGVQPNTVTAELMSIIGKKGAASVENQQITAAALSAAMAAAGTILMRTGVF